MRDSAVGHIKEEEEEPFQTDSQPISPPLHTSRHTQMDELRGLSWGVDHQPSKSRRLTRRDSPRLKSHMQLRSRMETESRRTFPTCAGGGIWVLAVGDFDMRACVDWGWPFLPAGCQTPCSLESPPETASVPDRDQQNDAPAAWDLGMSRGQRVQAGEKQCLPAVIATTTTAANAAAATTTTTIIIVSNEDFRRPFVEHV
nr:unnamed protein product [Spirometra erinaceieuropaei]